MTKSYNYFYTLIHDIVIPSTAQWVTFSFGIYYTWMMTFVYLAVIRGTWYSGRKLTAMWYRLYSFSLLVIQEKVSIFYELHEAFNSRDLWNSCWIYLDTMNPQRTCFYAEIFFWWWHTLSEVRVRKSTIPPRELDT